MNNIKISKFLSYVLRHKPESIGLKLNKEGWAIINDLLYLSQKAGEDLNKEALLEIIATNDKKRFAISEDGLKIRASQGHSIDIDLKLKEQRPPDTLYHGSAAKSYQSIIAYGIKAGTRNHVHLSSDELVAIGVGKRHGSPIILVIDSAKMYTDKIKFYLSDNKVWLTDYIDVKYIKDVIISKRYKKYK